MESATPKSGNAADAPLHLGSEYLDAPTYLAQSPRVRSLGAARKRARKDPQHGSNDSDFGAADQTQD